MRFSQRLKQLRKELNLRQDDLAKSCGVQLTAISKYENEIIKPAFEMLSKIGLAYNVNLNWLINEIGNMFIETHQRRLIKTGSDGFVTEEITEPQSVSVMEKTHNLDLEKDLKVEFYGNNETFTKIYRKDGNVEYQATYENTEKLQIIMQKLATICDDEDKYEFIMTAIISIQDSKALSELKIMIKGIELGQKK